MNSSKACRHCFTQFLITSEDQRFYTKIQIPEPDLCPDCRAQRRMAFRNEKTLYKRKCDLCQKNIISLYSSDKPFPVYCQECFWSDKWDPLEYGQEFNSSQPFFDQFDELLQKTPRLAIVNKQCQNSEYCNYSFANKNCYLTFGDHYEEDSMYGRYSTKNQNCLDFFWIYGSELGYEIMFSKNCYSCMYLDHCENCQDCLFSIDLKGCKHCLFCSNLRQKKYYILNTPYSEEEYFQKLKTYQLENSAGLMTAKNFFLGEFRTKYPVRATYQVNCQSCEGSNLENCKNMRSCFDCTNCEDVAYSSQIDETYSSMDMTCMGYDRGEVCYQTIGCTGTSFAVSCDSCWHNRDILYSNLCFSCQNVFGCVSLQQKKYCILNKQHTKEEYARLLPQVIKHLQRTKEWGRFFPPQIAPYAYNETIAEEYYPLTKEEITKNEWKWKDREEPDFSGVTKKIPAEKLPPAIVHVPDDVLNWATKCEESGRLFKIQKGELEFYRKMNLPLPHFHPDVRLEHRMKLRPPRQLWQRTCYKCGKSIQTTYHPSRPETVYCEECYLAAVY